MVSVRSLVIICAFTFFVELGLGSLTVMVGGFVDQLGFSLATAGRIASAEATAMAIACAVVVGLARPNTQFQRLIHLGLLLLGASNIACVLSREPAIFGLARFGSGFATGLVYGAGTLFIARLSEPDRPFAIYYGVVVFSSAIGLLVTPFVIAALGIQGTYFAYGCLALAGLSAARLYPAQSPNSADPVTARWTVGTATGIGAALVVLAMFINYAFNGGIWIYFERIGTTLHFEADRMGLILSVGTLIGLLGTFIAVTLGTRLGRFIPIAVAHGFAMLSVGLLLLGSPYGFYVAAALLNIAVSMFTPYSLSAVAVVDRSGRLALLGTLAALAGYGFGPAVISSFLSGENFRSALLWTQAAFAATLCIFAVAFLLLRSGRSVASEVLRDA